jgi:hypothetical protein
MSDVDQGVLPYAACSPPRTVARWARPQITLLVLGIAAWAFGVTQLQLASAGSYGLLASANVWFLFGLAAPLASLVLELRGDRRRWLLGAQLLALIVAIHATVPLLYGVPEYAWVYKHIGVASAFQRYGHITDPSNIYQQWPVLFAAVAAIASLGHVAITSLALWAPLAFEIADAFLLFAIFRLLSEDRRVPYLAVALYVCLVSWVGQDYLSPQAFAYLLWLGIAYVVLRWLRAPAVPDGGTGRLARLRAPLLAGMTPPAATSRATRSVMVAVVVVVYFAMVAAHQLTPYIVLAGVGALTLLDIVRPRWLLVALAVIAGAYLAEHYSLIASNWGLFSGTDPIQNASGSRGAYHAGPEALTAMIVRALAAFMWLSALWTIARKRAKLGRVAIPAALAFSPFVILGAQSYGGEAIYRVYMFSAPWCALLIATTICELRTRLRWPLAGAVCLAVLFAGVQGLYGPASVDAFTSNELSASHWLYSHIPRGSLIVLPGDNFPALESADYNSYDLEVMPSDPQGGPPWLNEGNFPDVERWITNDLGDQVAFIVVSRSMVASASYYGAPIGYATLVRTLPSEPGATLIYRNADTAIYRLDLVSTPRATATAAPRPAAALPARMAAARVDRLARSRRKTSGTVHSRYSRSSFLLKRSHPSAAASIQEQTAHR